MVTVHLIRIKVGADVELVLVDTDGAEHKYSLDDASWVAIRPALPAGKTAILDAMRACGIIDASVQPEAA